MDIDQTGRVCSDQGNATENGTEDAVMYPVKELRLMRDLFFNETKKVEGYKVTSSFSMHCKVSEIYFSLYKIKCGIAQII